jgi:hypothetical protein
LVVVLWLKSLKIIRVEKLGVAKLHRKLSQGVLVIEQISKWLLVARLTAFFIALRLLG